MKKVLIVGAGIAGLSAGIYARQSGFDVTIYESHTIPGGASTSWRRKGYLFEGGMHWLTGSSQKLPLNTLWREVGALSDQVQIYNRDPFMAFDYQGRTAYLYRDPEKLRRHFLELSPEDEKEINRLCRDVRKFSKISMPIMDIKGVKVKKKLPPPFSMLFHALSAMPRMSFYAEQTVKEYVTRFRSPLLRMLLESLIGGDYSASGMIFTVATLASGDGGYPVGGSLGMARRMAEKFEQLGGKIQYGRRVGKVRVENGIARGLMVEDEFVPADAVIVTQDTRAAIDVLFDRPLQEPWTDRLRKSNRPMLNTFISVGVEADLSSVPERVQFMPEQPLFCGGVSEPVVGICNYAGYAGYAPEGCTALTSAMIGDTYEFWKACKENGTYEAEKEKLAQAFIRILGEKYPHTAGKVAVWDVATPLTYERYLGSYKGSWMSVMGKGSGQETYPTKPESIENLYFAGQRLRSPGGGSPWRWIPGEGPRNTCVGIPAWSSWVTPEFSPRQLPNLFSQFHPGKMKAGPRRRISQTSFLRQIQARDSAYAMRDPGLVCGESLSFFRCFFPVCASDKFYPFLFYKLVKSAIIILVLQNRRSEQNGN